MIILGLETSCDETSAAVVNDGREVLSNIISSQVETHVKFGGVVPEIAARKHIESIGFIVQEALNTAKIKISDIDGFAAANGPGLAGALLVAVNYAKGLSFATKKPLVGVNHIEAHITANFIDHPELQPPFISLVVSGGHTLIIEVKDFNDYKILGSTRDDAAGEAFDKVARILKLPYPGGPEIDKLAESGNPEAYHFPRAKVDGADFSFSGLKTAVQQFINKNPEYDLNDLAASFRQAIVDVLVNKTITEAEKRGYTKITLAGGVACNIKLRKDMLEKAKIKNLSVYYPSPVLCTDNAAMIASRGYYSIKNGYYSRLNLNVFPSRITAFDIDKIL